MVESSSAFTTAPVPPAVTVLPLFTSPSMVPWMKFVEAAPAPESAKPPFEPPASERARPNVADSMRVVERPETRSPASAFTVAKSTIARAVFAMSLKASDAPIAPAKLVPAEAAKESATAPPSVLIFVLSSAVTLKSPPRARALLPARTAAMTSSVMLLTATAPAPLRFTEGPDARPALTAPVIVTARIEECASAATVSA